MPTLCTFFKIQTNKQIIINCGTFSVNNTTQNKQIQLKIFKQHVYVEGQIALG